MASRIQAKATKRKVNIIQQVADEAKARGIVNVKARQSLEWYRNFIRKNVFKVKVFENLDNRRLKMRPTIGKLYMFGYDAKHKDDLPYWDAFPCSLIFAEDETTFYGLNLHYVPIEVRLEILKRLYDIMTDDILTEKTRMLKSYSFLKGLSVGKLVQPCVKRYLKTNFTTFLIEVPADQWPIAAFLPTARWQKASVNTVYANSKKQMRG